VPCRREQFEKEFHVEEERRTTKDSIPSGRQLKKLSTTQPAKKLV
jgi:hypothetical protein